MARDPDIERRLLNWARWKNAKEGGGGNFARTDMTVERVDGAGWDWSQEPPTFEGEAITTDQAVMALPSELRATVEMAYLGAGSVQHMMARLQIARCTVYTRIDQAHRRLRTWFAERAEAARVQLARDEAVRRSARP